MRLRLQPDSDVQVRDDSQQIQLWPQRPFARKPESNARLIRGGHKIRIRKYGRCCMSAR